MNKIYKVIWSKTQHCFVVVSELCRSKTKILSVSEAHIIPSSPKKHFSFSKAFKITPIVAGLLLAGFSTFAYAAPSTTSTNSQINTVNNTATASQTKNVLLQATRQNSVLVDTIPLTIPNETTVSAINSSGDVNIGSNTNVTLSGISASGSVTITGNSNTITVSGIVVSGGVAISGNSVGITGNNNTITVSGRFVSNNVAINGSNSVIISGTSNTINGNVNSSGSVSISGTSNVINNGDVNGNSVSISGNSNIIGSVGGSSSVSIAGNSNIINGIINSSGTVNVSGSDNIISQTGIITFNKTVNIEAKTVNISGSSNSITQSNNNVISGNIITLGGNTINLSGSSNSITQLDNDASRGGDIVTLSGSDINISSGNSITQDDNMTILGGDIVTLSGSDINISGTNIVITQSNNAAIPPGGNIVTISGNSINITGSHVVITQSSNSAIGNGNDIVTLSGSTVNILGNNNTIQSTENVAFGTAISAVIVTISGSSNTVSAGIGGTAINTQSSVTITGTSNSIIGNIISSGAIDIIGSSNVIGSINTSASVNVSGNYNKFSPINSSGMVTILGSGNTVQSINTNTTVNITGTDNVVKQTNNFPRRGGNITAISGDTVNITENNGLITTTNNFGTNFLVISGNVVNVTGNDDVIAETNNLNRSNGNLVGISGNVINITGNHDTVTAIGGSGVVELKQTPSGSVINVITTTGVGTAIFSNSSFILSGSHNTINGNIESVGVSGNTTISGDNTTINGNITSSGDINLTGIAGNTDGAQVFGNVTASSSLTLTNAWVTGTVQGATEQVNGGFLTASTNTLNSNVTVGTGERLGFIKVNATETPIITPHTLTINGNLTGNGGVLQLNTTLSTQADSRVDNLIVTDEVSGTTIPIDITNTSQEGGETNASGIEIISANRVASTDTTPFRLDAPNGILSVGAYDYRLVSGISSGGSTTWSLVSTISPPITILPALDSTSSSTSPETNLVVTYSPLAYLVSIPNFVLQNATTENVDAINDVMQQTTDSRLQGQAPGHDIWFKLIQAYNNNDTRGTVSTNYKNNLYGFLLGGDVLHLKQDSLGVYTGYQNGSVDAIGTTYSNTSGTLLTIPNSSVGNLTLNDYTIGIYNQYHVHSFIVNAFLQDSLGDMKTSNIPAISNDAKFNINSLAAQATVGYAVTLSKSLELIPFGGVQGTWDHLDNASFKDSTGTVTTVDFKHDNAVSVLAGVNGYLTLAKGKNATPIIHLTFGTDIQQYLGNSNTNNIDIPANGFTSNFNSSIGKTFMNVNVGVGCQATKNIYLGLGVALGYNLGSVHAINFSSTEKFHMQYYF